MAARPIFLLNSKVSSYHINYSDTETRSLTSHSPTNKLKTESTWGNKITPDKAITSKILHNLINILKMNSFPIFLGLNIFLSHSSNHTLVLTSLTGSAGNITHQPNTTESNPKSLKIILGDKFYET